jgi:hypothetical protein
MRVTLMTIQRHVDGNPTVEPEIAEFQGDSERTGQLWREPRLARKGLDKGLSLH